MKVRFTIAAVAFFFSCGVSVFSQSAPDVENGFKAYGSYDGSSIDSVNLMNGNLMLHIPMPFSYPQRGKIDPRNILTVSSKQWHVQCQALDCSWTSGTGDVPSIIANAGNGVGFDITTGSVVHRTYEADGTLPALHTLWIITFSTPRTVPPTSLPPCLAAPLTRTAIRSHGKQ